MTGNKLIVLVIAVLVLFFNGNWTSNGVLQRDKATKQIIRREEK